MLSNTLGIELHTINTTEGGGLGAIILAMVGNGKYKNVTEACKKIIKIQKVFKPHIKIRELYLKQYKKFRHYYLTIKNE
jgi:xylulokinase